MSSSRKHICGKTLKKALRKIIIAGIVLFLSACREQIIHNLDESEANRYLSKLHELDAGAEKIKQADGQWGIAVERAKAIPAIKHLEGARMLKSPPPSSNDKPSLISSREDQRFQFERALSREIESTLSSIDGVLESRVHLNLPQVDPVLGHRLPNSHGTGSVLLVIQKKFSLTTDMIADLVSGASGIDKSQIAVLFNLEQPAAEDLQLTNKFPQAMPPTIQPAQNITSDQQPEVLLDRKVIMWPLIAFLCFGLLLVFKSRKHNLPNKLNQPKGEVFDDFAGDIL